MAFRDLEEFYEDGLDLPIGGRVYHVSSPSAEVGLWCQALLQAGADVHAGRKPRELADLDDDEETHLYSRVLGPAFQQMLDDGVVWDRVQHAGKTAFFWIAADKQTAERFWEGDLGEQEAPNRATRRASTRSKSTGGASGTRRRASTSTTSSPKASDHGTAKKRKTATSRGETS